MNILGCLKRFSSLAKLTALCLASLFCGSLAACHSNSQENPPVRSKALVQNDPHSYANASEAKIQHLDLDLKVNFEKKILEGTAILQLQNSSPGTNRLICDTSQLSIESVEASSREGDYQPAKYQLGNSDPILGTPLIIPLPPQTFQVRIRYATSPRASALQWMDSAQTAGRKHPFLYSQSQPIHCRSWIPLQDSPQVRLTYLARIHVPKGLRAVMSASQLTHTDEEFSFEMKQPIPSYLIAIAVGDLGFKALGPRTGVYAEPEILARAAKEFSDTEKVLNIAEKMFGDYRWGRYDLLILPPSFPYGGMENATLTFLSPTVIAGDGSLLNIITHELSHSWAGNLVTNDSWNDLWLNEGITTYLENRLMEAWYGNERADMELAVQKQSLLKTMQGQSTKETVLHLNLDAQNPEEAANDVAYVKGALFMRYLEETFGRETFDQFLRRYFDQFAFQSINSEKFEAYLKSDLLPHLPTSSSHSKEEIVASVHEWLYSPGLPQSSSPIRSRRLEAVTAQAQQWVSRQLPTSKLQASSWSVEEWKVFFKETAGGMTPRTMQGLDQRFHLTASRNMEIAFQWLLLSVEKDYKNAFPRLEEFLTSVGRNKYVKPLYAQLAKTEQGKKKALLIYGRARPMYHPITVEAVDAILDWKEEPAGIEQKSR